MSSGICSIIRQQLPLELPLSCFRGVSRFMKFHQTVNLCLTVKSVMIDKLWERVTEEE